MKKSEVVIGQTYLMNHTSGRIHVRILREVGQYKCVDHSNGTIHRMAHWQAENLKTGRTIDIKSATKLSPLPPPDQMPNEWLMDAAGYYPMLRAIKRESDRFGG